MLNFLWLYMILIGIIVAAFTGRMPDVTNAALTSAKDAVSLCITMLGVLSMWTGLMKIAEQAGLIKALSRRMAPLLSFLFPEIPKGNRALQYISTNIIANVLGLGWAATPPGLKAMQELQKLNSNKKVASKSMCMFMIINMSSLQLVSMNIIAYRMECGSTNPTEIIGPGILATSITTLAALIFARVCEARSDLRKFC